jgi:hypothetical protein
MMKNINYLCFPEPGLNVRRFQYYLVSMMQLVKFGICDNCSATF